MDIKEIRKLNNCSDLDFNGKDLNLDSLTYLLIQLIEEYDIKNFNRTIEKIKHLFNCTYNDYNDFHYGKKRQTDNSVKLAVMLYYIGCFSVKNNYKEFYNSLKTMNIILNRIVIHNNVIEETRKAHNIPKQNNRIDFESLVVFEAMLFESLKKDNIENNNFKHFRDKLSSSIRRQLGILEIKIS